VCRLLGLIANKPVDLAFSLKKFEKFASGNPDGWGIGWYSQRQANVFKEGISANNSLNYSHMSKHVRSHIIISHVRLGTGAEPAKRNSHPFICKNWMFAHNGRVDKDHLESLLCEEYFNKIKGATDSELYFYWLLQNITEKGDVIKGIKSAVDEIINNGSYSGLNFILSDGTRLYAFRYSGSNPGYYSLYALRRVPSKNVPFEYYSEETGALLLSKSLNGEQAVLVSSEPLTLDEEWEPIKMGNLLVVEDDLSMRQIDIVRW